MGAFGFLMFSYGFTLGAHGSLTVFLWWSYSFPLVFSMVVLWFCMILHCFPMVLHWFPIVFLWFSNVFLCYSNGPPA